MQVDGFASDLLAHFQGPQIALREELVAAQAFSDELEKKFSDSISQFKSEWTAGQSQS